MKSSVLIEFTLRFSLVLLEQGVVESRHPIHGSAARHRREHSGP